MQNGKHADWRVERATRYPKRSLSEDSLKMLVRQAPRPTATGVVRIRYFFFKPNTCGARQPR